jgi:hypothetical protein
MLIEAAGLDALLLISLKNCFLVEEVHSALSECQSDSVGHRSFPGHNRQSHGHDAARRTAQFVRPG